MVGFGFACNNRSHTYYSIKYITPLLYYRMTRPNKYEIEGLSDRLPWNKAQKAAYKKRSLSSILDEVRGIYRASYNRIPVDYRVPTINIPFEDPTPYELFSLLITLVILAVTALYTNLKAD